MALLVVATLWWLEATDRHSVLQGSLSRLGQARGDASVVSTTGSRIELPKFNARSLPELLETAGRKHAVPIHAVVYSLEDSNSHPFQRYRASFSMSAGYPLQRKVLSEILSSSTAITLDSIVCSRGESPADPLACDIAVSAFYARDSHG